MRERAYTASTASSYTGTAQVKQETILVSANVAIELYLLLQEELKNKIFKRANLIAITLN